MGQAPRALVVSMQKSGTHLLQNVMLELGYRIVGVPRPEPDTVPVFDDEQRKAIAALTLSKEDHERVLALAGTDADSFVRATDDAWAALTWSWQRRLGQRVVNRYGQNRYDFAEHVITNPHLSYTRFADTPRGLCWIFHELDVDKVDGNFLAEWVDTGQPPIVLNYRDPRDALVSMINFLEGRTPQGYGNFYEFDVFSAILASKPTWEEKIDYAIRDRSFIGRDELETSMWLLHHPAVCKVSYEDLVGPRGGGSRERQVAAIERLLRHLGANEDPERVADRVYDTGSWSFYRGRSGAWRETFTERNVAHFRAEFGDVLAQYGYE